MNSLSDNVLVSNQGLNPPNMIELLTLTSEITCHDHAYSQMVIALQGRSEFEIQGRAQILLPGQGCWIKAQDRHAFSGMEPSSDIFVLNLPNITESEEMLKKLHALGHYDIYFQLDNQMQKWLQWMAFELRNNPDDTLLHQGCRDTFIALMMRHISTHSTSQRASRFNLDTIDHYIETHICYKITVAQLAGCVFLGESQFHRIFKEKVGMTPHQYLLEKRINMACDLIQEGKFKLSQIADLTGFSSQSAFTHVFSRLRSLSPSEYKKRHSA